MTLTNKSTQPLEVDWNRTRYLHCGKDFGSFVFAGIDPESIKTGIPIKVIPAGKIFSKRIMPLKTLAFRGRRETRKSGQSNFYPGILPNGANAVALVVIQGTREWNELMSVQIGRHESRKK